MPHVHCTGRSFQKKKTESIATSVTALKHGVQHSLIANAELYCISGIAAVENMWPRRCCTRANVIPLPRTNCVVFDVCVLYIVSFLFVFLPPFVQALPACLRAWAHQL